MKVKTTITISGASQMAKVKTSDPDWMDRLDWRCEAMPDDCMLIGTVTELGEVVEKYYEIAREMIVLGTEEEEEGEK